MRINKLVVLVAILVIPLLGISQSNRTRQASCASGSTSRFYITPYIGAGGSSYTYSLNNTVYDTDSNVYNNESGSLFTAIAGINLMYNIGRGNLGGGAEFQNFSGKTNNGLFETDHNMYFYKFFGRYEYKIYYDSFSDFGIFLEGGLLFPNQVHGDSPSMGPFFKGGLFYNLIINSTSSLLIGVDYQYASFTTQIGGAESNHKITDIKLSVGYRFWFKR